MKTLKLSVIAIAWFAISFTAKAGINEIASSSASQFYAINTYVNTMTTGNLDGFEQVLDNTAKFSLLHGAKIHSYDKAEMVSFLKENKNYKQSCTVSTTIVSSDANVTVVKVDMQYDGMVRSNYVTLANDGKDWKITDVYTVFK